MGDHSNQPTSHPWPTSQSTSQPKPANQSQQPTNQPASEIPSWEQIGVGNTVLVTKSVLQKRRYNLTYGFGMPKPRHGWPMVLGWLNNFEKTISKNVFSEKNTEQLFWGNRFGKTTWENIVWEPNLFISELDSSKKTFPQNRRCPKKRLLKSLMLKTPHFPYKLFFSKWGCPNSTFPNIVFPTLQFRLHKSLFP